MMTRALKKAWFLQNQYHGASRLSIFKRLYTDSDSEDAAKQYYESYRRIFADERKHRESSVDETQHLNHSTTCDRLHVNNLKQFGAPQTSNLTHVNQDGKVNMVAIDNKPQSRRKATAFCKIYLGSEAFDQVKTNGVKKGDVLCVSKIAGIMAAKKTSSIIPLCHNITLSKVDVSIELMEEESSLHLYCSASSVGQTGVEMEALVGVTTAALTVYDMCKAVTRDMHIGDVRLLNKTGGVRSDYEYSG